MESPLRTYTHLWGDWFLPHEHNQKVKREAWLCSGCNAANLTYIGYKCWQDVHDDTEVWRILHGDGLCAYHRANTLKPFCWRITPAM
jgi:hypothetical protein